MANHTLRNGWVALNAIDPDLVQHLRTRASGDSAFFKSLSDQCDRRDLSTRQISVLTADMDKYQRSIKNRPVPMNIDISRLIAMFDIASQKIKKPRLVFGDLVISRAMPHSKNPGSLYIKRDGEYVGKVSPQGEASLPADVVGVITEIAADPKDYMLRFGRQTGMCCACGRELTEAVSVVHGIGPICASRYGFDRMSKAEALATMRENRMEVTQEVLDQLNSNSEK